VTSCGSRSGEAGPGSDVATSPRNRLAADRSAQLSGAIAVQSFGADLFRAMTRQAGNLVCSPYSVAVALAMTRNGARGETADEMDRVLHAPPLEQLNAALNALTQHVEGLAHQRQRPDGSDASVTLDVANSLWGQRGVGWEPAFLDALARSYGAGMRLTDYLGDPEQARHDINLWTGDRTRGRIPELIGPGILNHLTRLVLVNAIYLKAPWATPFLKNGTQDAAFTRADGSHVTVPMMRSDDEAHIGYASGRGWQAVDVPYDPGGLAMAIVVPDQGQLDRVEQALDGAAVHNLLGAFQPTSVSLRLPRWTFRTQVMLNEVLIGLGMPTAFSEARADFRGMTTQQRLLIDAVVHEAFIAVDEQGTEAAAATAVVMRATSAVVPSVEVTVDRPFLFVLHDVETGTPLFIGRVSDPAAR
jgi:serine protease inhibitor